MGSLTRQPHSFVLAYDVLSPTGQLGERKCVHKGGRSLEQEGLEVCRAPKSTDSVRTNRKAGGPMKRGAHVRRAVVLGLLPPACSQ